MRCERAEEHYDREIEYLYGKRPGAGVDLEHYAELVFFASEHVAELEVLDKVEDAGVLGVDVGFFYEALLEEVEGELELLGLGGHLFIRVEPEVEVLYFLHLGLGALAVVPEVGHVGAELLFLDLDLLGVDVEVAGQVGDTGVYVLELFEGDHGVEVGVFKVSKVFNDLDAECLLSYGGAGAAVGVGVDDPQGAVGVLDAEDHAFADDAAELAGREVGDEADAGADEVFGLVVLGDAGDDGASARAVVDAELEKLVGLGDLAALEDLADADVEFLEVVESALGLDAGRFPGVEFVGFLGLGEAVELGLDGGVVNLLEEDFGLGEEGAGGDEGIGAEHLPVVVGEEEHLAELVGHEGEEGLEGDLEAGADLHGHVHDGPDSLRFCLDELPGLAIGQVLVAGACHVHGVAEGVAELEILQAVGELAGFGA